LSIFFITDLTVNWIKNIIL